MDNNVSAHVATDSVVVIGGKTFVLTQPTIKNVVAMVNWLKDQEINRAKRQMEGLDTELQKLLLKDAIDYARKIEMNTPEFAAKMESLESVAFMFWTMVRQNQNGMTYDAALELIANNPTAIETLSNALAKAFGGNPTTSPTTTA